MTRLYRPTLHQIHALQWYQAGPEQPFDPFDPVDDALRHVARALEPTVTRALADQFAQARRSGLDPLARVPLVRSADLYPVPGHAPLRAALFAYQDGTAFLVHLTWHWDGEGNVETFQELRGRLWVPAGKTAGDLGQGLLVTAALLEPPGDRAALARAMLAPLDAPTGSLAGLPLDGAVLYVPRRRPLHPAPWPAALLFESPEVEETVAADRFTTVEWPLVVLYHLRVEGLYLEEYQPRVVDRLREHGRALGQALEHTFRPSEGEGAPTLLVRRNLGQIQRALTRLSGPQYTFLKALSEAERRARDARRELRNLEEAARATLSLPLAGQPTDPAEVERAVGELTRPARHCVAQMESDVAEARALADRTARAVDVLRTQADILEASYERKLNWVIGLVGTALAVGQIVDERTARVLYTLLGGLWQTLGGAPLSPFHPDMVFLMRLVAMALAMPLVWLVLYLFLRPR